MMSSHWLIGFNIAYPPDVITLGVTVMGMPSGQLLASPRIVGCNRNYEASPSCSCEYLYVFTSTIAYIVLTTLMFCSECSLTSMQDLCVCSMRASTYLLVEENNVSEKLLY